MASGDLRRPLVDSSVILCLLFFPECTGKVKREICMPSQTPGALITPPVFISPLKRSTSRRARRSRRDKIHRAARTRRPDVDAGRRVRLRVINVRFSHVKKTKQKTLHLCKYGYKLCTENVHTPTQITQKLKRIYSWHILCKRGHVLNRRLCYANWRLSNSFNSLLK